MVGGPFFSVSCCSVRHCVCACSSYLFDVRGLEEEDASLCEQSLVGAMLIDTMYSLVWASCTAIVA